MSNEINILIVCKLTAQRSFTMKRRVQSKHNVKSTKRILTLSVSLTQPLLRISSGVDGTFAVNYAAQVMKYLLIS